MDTEIKNPDVNDQTKALLVIERIKLWNNTRYAAELDLRVARRIGDKALEDQAVQQVKNCEAALMELEVIQKELNGEDKEK